jgi:small-conductance mechanosensitive channel
MVRRHRTLLWHRTHRVFEAAALFVWAAGTLEMFSLRTPLVEHAKTLIMVWHKAGDEWRSDFTFLGQILSFGAVVWAAFLLSRFIRFVLEEDFFPRIQMERGLSYAVSTMLHYAVLLLGFYIAASATGIDMTKFTILAGAFGVGMGFGLQNIINNFVSGIILLFERPVKVGDVVQMNDVSGVVDHIGIRASIIRTGSGSEIIVPNGKFISDQVINWTFSNRQRGIEIPVSVASGVDPCRVLEILTRVAKAHPLVSSKPAPNAQLTDLGADALQYKLNAWTDCIEQWGQIRSDLAVAINAEFVKESIRRAAPPAPV